MPLIKNYYQAIAALGLSSGATEKEIKKAYREKSLKYYPEKWKQTTKAGKKCKDGRCSLKPREKDEKWFCSDACRNTYKAVERNFQRIQESYDLLTGKTSPEPDQPDDPSPCDHCKKPTYGKFYHEFRSRKDKNGNAENFLFCSEKCYNDFRLPEEPEDFQTCPFCQQKYLQGTGVYFREEPETVFCTKECAFSWEREKRDKKDLASQRTNFITQNLEKLSNWDSLSEEEKQNFIEQVNNSESEQFENILRQAKNLIREKQALSPRGRKDRKNNSGQNHTSDHNSDSGYDSNQSQDSESEAIPNLLSLAQSQAQAEEKIQKSLKNSGISETKLNQILGGTDWKEALKKLDTPQKIEEFTNKIEQEILKIIKLSEQSNSTKDKSPKNEWVLPTIILGVSFLALTSLILVVRKKKQKGGI